MSVNALVSVIIPVHNRPLLLREAVASVLAQTYRPIEIIIVDDGSTDETLEISQKLALDNQEVKVFSQKNQGPGAAREHGRLQAEGQYVQYLDSDDVLLPTKFEKQISTFRENPSSGICYAKQARRAINFAYLGEIHFTDSDAINFTGEKVETIFPRILHGPIWGTSVALWRKEACDQVGAWLPLINEEDMEYDARAGAQHISVAYVPEFLAIQRTHDDHLSSGGTTDPRKLIDILAARKKILQHALSSGLTVTSPDLQHYAKSAFLLARMFAAQGMKTEMLKAMELSEKASGKAGYKLVCYRQICRLLGLKVTQKLFSMFEQFR